MSLIKVVPYVVGVTPGVPDAPEPRMYPRSGYFLVVYVTANTARKYNWTTAGTDSRLTVVSHICSVYLVFLKYHVI